MRVYELTASGNYAGALAIVAANNRAQALKLALDVDHCWHGANWEWVQVKCVRGLTMECRLGRVISNFTWIE